MDEDIVLHLSSSTEVTAEQDFASFNAIKIQRANTELSRKKPTSNHRPKLAVKSKFKPQIDDAALAKRHSKLIREPKPETGPAFTKSKPGKRKDSDDSHVHSIIALSNLSPDLKKKSARPHDRPKSGIKGETFSTGIGSARIAKKKIVRSKKNAASLSGDNTTKEVAKKVAVPVKKKEHIVHDDVFTGDQFSSISELDRKLVARLEGSDGFGFIQTTAVQKLAIPKLLAGNDCFIRSQTGSGKTLAYAVPCVQKLSEMEPRIRRQDGPFAIILTPTRELAIQTYDVFEKLLKAFIWIVPGYIAGGEKRKSEKARLRKGINVLVCTPGRLTDHLRQTSCLSLDKVKWMIYDEADRLLDGGFEQDIKSLIDRLRLSSHGQCQSVLLSATLNKSVSQLVDLALTNPVFVSPASVDSGAETSALATSDDAYVLPASLRQFYVVMPAKQRLLTLIALIFWKFEETSEDYCRKMLIFLATQDAVDFHYYLLDHIINGRASKDDDKITRPKRKRIHKTNDEDEDGLVFNVEIYRLHGNMSQQERTAVYKEFSASKRALLLATDVAARGLHIPRLDCIVQYNTPGVPAEYVHRVGRTARMGTDTAELGHPRQPN